MMIMRKYAGVLLMVCLIAGSAFASNSWTALTGSWGTPPGGADADWSAGIVPAATEQVKITDGNTCTVDVTTCVFGAQKLTVGTTGAAGAVLNIVSGGTLNAGAEVQIGGDGGIVGRVTQTGGTVNLVNGAASAKIEVGYKAGVGYYTISGGSIVGDANYSQLQVGASGANGGNGTFTVQGTGGSISVAKMYVGASTSGAQYTGTGTLAFEIDGGVSAINAGSVYIDPTNLVAAVANLSVIKTGALPTGDIILINNTRTSGIQGAFDNVAWGSIITLGDVNYTLTNTYIGGLDGIANDVALIADMNTFTFTLTYTAGANGSIIGTTPQTVKYDTDGTAVTAQPDPGYHFVKWSDDSTQNPRTDVNVMANITVTASFAIDTFALTYTADANGSIVGTTPQTVNYEADGTAVTAQPALGYHFVKWSDDSTANPRTDTGVTANITVTASFAIDTFTLTYTADANGGIIGTTLQTVNYGTDGTAVTAQPALGYHFVKWSDDSTQNPRTDINVTANITVTASFAIGEIDTFTLTYTAGANGSIIGTTPQTVNYGADGTAVTAQPALGYHFVKWSDDSTQNPRTDLNVTANITVTANFAINTFTLTYTADANGSIVGTTPQTVNYGANGTAVTAQPALGYHFVKWSDDSTQNPRTDLNVTANITVTASFAIDTFTLTYTAGANGSIIGTTPQTVNYGTDGTAVTAQPALGYHFVKWSDDSTQNPRTDLNVTANITVTASFAIGTFTLTYTAGANGSIVGTTPQTVNYGANGTAVTASPHTGYHFVNWSDSSAQNPRTDINVTANITVQASFAIDTIVIAVSKCKVAAGKTQYLQDGDYNNMKDSFTASGTVVLPTDVNDIDSVVVTITSTTDDYVVYTETWSDFNATVVNDTRKYTHSPKVTKGQAGKITSLKFDFSKGTFAIATKNIDLTGLSCPFEIKFVMGSYELKGNATETIVNGTKTIPTRLMRLYDDKLVVTTAKAKNSTKVLSDTLSVKGDIAVADMNLDANEPNLCNEDVILTWGDGDVNTQTFVIPAGSFTASKKGHTYKCSKVVTDANDCNAGIVTATIDLDKCTFTASVKGATGLYADVAGTAVFGISFDTEEGTFDEEDDYTLP